jgi:hypothetical protein
MDESIFLVCDHKSGLVATSSEFSPSVVWSIEGIERVATDSACTIVASTEFTPLEDPFVLCAEAAPQSSPCIRAVRRSQLANSSVRLSSTWNIRSLQSNPESGIFHLESTLDSLLLNCAADGVLSLRSADVVGRWDGWCIDQCGPVRDRHVLRPFYAKSLPEKNSSNSNSNGDECSTPFQFDVALPLFLTPRAIPGKPLGVVEMRALSLLVPSLALKNDKFLVSNATGGATLAIDESGAVVSTKNKGVQEAFSLDYVGGGQYRIRRTKEANPTQLARATSSTGSLSSGGGSSTPSPGGRFLLACDAEGVVKTVIVSADGEEEKEGVSLGFGEALWRIRKTVKGLLIYVHRRVGLTNLICSSTTPTATNSTTTVESSSTTSLLSTQSGYLCPESCADPFPGQFNNCELVPVFSLSNLSLKPSSLIQDEVVAVRKLVESDRAFQLVRLFHVRNRYLRARFDNECHLFELKNGAKSPVLSLFQASPRSTLASSSEVFSKSRLSIDIDARRNTGDEKGNREALECSSMPYGRGYYFAASLKLPHKMNWNPSENVLLEATGEKGGDDEKDEKDLRVAVVYYVNIGRCAAFGHRTAESLTSAPLVSPSSSLALLSNACGIDPMRFDSVCGLENHVGGTVVESELDGLQFVVYCDRQVCPAFLVQYRVNPQASILEKTSSSK